MLCLWFGLLNYWGRLVRISASACSAYDCSVCYVQCEASPEQHALRTVGDLGIVSALMSLLFRARNC